MFNNIVTELKLLKNYPDPCEKSGIVIFCKAEYNHKTIDEVFKLIYDKNETEKGYGYHYIVSGKKVYNLVPTHKAIKSFNEKKVNYIGKNVFDSKPNSKLTSILVILEPKVDYAITETTLIHEVQRLMKAHKIYSENIWRSFDICDEDYSPLHMLDLNIFKSHVNLLEKFVPTPKTGGHDFDEEAEDKPNDPEYKPEPPPPIDEVEYISPFKTIAESSNKTIDKYVRDIYSDNEGKEKEYAKKFKPWDKDLASAKEATVGELQSIETPTKNTLQYQITTQPPQGSCGCSSDFDALAGTLVAKDTMVEPIYPDLITPPGANITVSNDSTGTKVPSESNAALTPEEFEKRQQQFSFKDFDKVKKETIGRPINCEDPFPVDEQIKKLEEHNPKIKIDKIKFSYEDSNHDGDLVGQAISKNNNMIYDVLMDIAKRTETRLVKIENNLSTVMRNLFRVSSRMNINCAYYGGQSVYGKYNCIRCLSDDRINDGAVVSLDQCLSCTRYEPILGQVYAILDDAATNVTTVIDDMQMSYMSIEDYNALTQFGEYWQSPKVADLNKHATDKPKAFVEDKWKDTEAEAKAKGKTKEDIDSKDYKQGFSMDWTPVQLETQSPNINKYKKEEVELDKESISEDLDREIFDDTRDGNVQYEQLEFDIKDYILEDFGKGSSLTNGGGGDGGALIRQKIVDYMHQAEARAKDGKLHYSQGKRMNHDDKAENGIHYYDCSSLVGAAYKAAGIPGLNGGNTVSQYPKYTDKQGGLIFPISELKNAKPGDILCFTNAKHPKTKEELQNFNSSQTVHTAIYIGDNKYIDTGRHYPDDPSKDCKTKDRNNYVDKRMFAFARPKELVEADSVASSEGLSEQWSREYHGISDELWKAARYEKGDYDLTKKNMNKYNWKNLCIEEAKKAKMDPFLIAALISVESKGDPRDNDKYAGLMQVHGHYGSTSQDGMRDNIKKGIGMFKAKFTHLKNCGWVESNLHVALSAYNSGEGCVTGAASRSNVKLASCKIPELGDALKKHVQIAFPSWSSNEKREYATKVLKAYNFIWNDNMLGLPRESSKQFIRPVNHYVSSIFGPRNGRMHKGVDYGCPIGTPIKASASGEVTHAETQDGYGQVIYLKHANGYTTRYAHLSDYKGRKPGDKVKQGDILCLSGNTGVGTGPHLHFEIRKNGEALNPGDHVPKSSKKNEKV